MLVSYGAVWNFRTSGDASASASGSLRRLVKLRQSGRAFKMASQRGGAWRSLVAHLLWEQEVGGSNPSAPTSFDDFHRRDLVIR